MKKKTHSLVVLLGSVVLLSSPLFAGFFPSGAGGSQITEYMKYIATSTVDMSSYPIRGLQEVSGVLGSTLYLGTTGYQYGALDLPIPCAGISTRFRSGQSGASVLFTDYGVMNYGFPYHDISVGSMFLKGDGGGGFLWGVGLGSQWGTLSTEGLSVSGDATTCNAWKFNKVGISGVADVYMGAIGGLIGGSGTAPGPLLYAKSKMQYTSSPTITNIWDIPYKYYVDLATANVALTEYAKYSATAPINMNGLNIQSVATMTFVNGGYIADRPLGGVKIFTSDYLYLQANAITVNPSLTFADGTVMTSTAQFNPIQEYMKYSATAPLTMNGQSIQNALVQTTNTITGSSITATGLIISSFAVIGELDQFGRPQLWLRGAAGAGAFFRMGANTSEGDPYNEDSDGFVMWRPSDNTANRAKSDSYGLTRCTDSSLYYFRVDGTQMYFNRLKTSTDTIIRIDAVNGGTTFYYSVKISSEIRFADGTVLASTAGIGGTLITEYAQYGSTADFLLNGNAIHNAGSVTSSSLTVTGGATIGNGVVVTSTGSITAYELTVSTIHGLSPVHFPEGITVTTVTLADGTILTSTAGFGGSVTNPLTADLNVSSFGIVDVSSIVFNTNVGETDGLFMNDKAIHNARMMDSVCDTDLDIGGKYIINCRRISAPSIAIQISNYGTYGTLYVYDSGDVYVMPAHGSGYGLLVNDTFDIYDLNFNGGGLLRTDTAGSLILDNTKLYASSMSVSGQVDYTDAGVVWEDVQVNGFGTGAGAAAPSLTAFGPSGRAQVQAFQGASTDDTLYFSIQLPHWYKPGSNLDLHLHWSPGTTGTGNVIWEVMLSSAIIDADFSTEVVLTSTAPARGVAWQHTVSTFGVVLGAGFDRSTFITGRLRRLATSPNDTYDGANAFFHGIDVHAQRSRNGTATSY